MSVRATYDRAMEFDHVSSDRLIRVVLDAIDNEDDADTIQERIEDEFGPFTCGHEDCDRDLDPDGTCPDYCSECRQHGYEDNECGCYCSRCAAHNDDCDCCRNCDSRANDCNCCRVCGDTNSECDCCRHCDGDDRSECDCCQHCGSSNRAICNCCQECGDPYDRCHCCIACHESDDRTCQCVRDADDAQASLTGLVRYCEECEHDYSGTVACPLCVVRLRARDSFPLAYANQNV